jgi:hypothetical protein
MRLKEKGKEDYVNDPFLSGLKSIFLIS